MGFNSAFKGLNIWIEVSFCVLGSDAINVIR